MVKLLAMGVQLPIEDLAKHTEAAQVARLYRTHCASSLHLARLLSRSNSPELKSRRPEVQDDASAKRQHLAEAWTSSLKYCMRRDVDEERQAGHDFPETRDVLIETPFTAAE